MQPNRTNTFRLHRLSHTSNTCRHSQSIYNPDETFKLAAIHSVSKGVKHNDITFLTGRDLSKLRNQPNESNDPFLQFAHLSLTEVRKKYDEIKKSKDNKEQIVKGLKEEFRKCQILQDDLKKKVENHGQGFRQTFIGLNSKKEDFEDVFNDKKVLLQMQARLKADNVVYSQRITYSEMKLQNLRKQLAIIRRQQQEVEGSKNRTIKVHDQLLRRLSSENIDRKEHILNLKGMITQRQKKNEHSLKREEEMIEIAERAMQDKNYSEKEWNKIFLTHKLVHCLLRQKIQREMEKFKTVEFAFKVVKTATGVHDAHSLVYKYLNKENVYGQLLSKISQNQRRISQLKAEQDKIRRQQKALQAEKDMLNSVKIKSIDLHDNLKQMDFISNKALMNKTMALKMKSWLKSKHKKIVLMEKQSYQQTPEQPGEPENNQAAQQCPQSYLSLTKSFKAYLYSLQDLLKKTEQSYQNGQRQQIMSEPSVHKLLRIEPNKMVPKGEEALEPEEEGSRSIIYEELTLQKEQILRYNQKFMKELKKRQEEARKLIIEKKKEPRMPQPKKPQD